MDINIMYIFSIKFIVSCLKLQNLDFKVFWISHIYKFNLKFINFPFKIKMLYSFNVFTAKKDF